MHKFAMSFDSASLRNACDLADLKVVCRCLAGAIRKHIEFAAGREHLSDFSNSSSTSADPLAPTQSLPSHELSQPGPGVVQEPEEVKMFAPLQAEHCTQLMAESFSAIAGEHIDEEMLNSYITSEEPENDVDLSYTQSHLDDFLHSSMTTPLPYP